MKKLKAKLNYIYDTWRKKKDKEKYMKIKKKTVGIINDILFRNA